MEILTKEEVKRVLIGNMFYILLESISSKVKGKRVRKKILKVIRKEIAILREKSPYEYIVLVNMSVDVITTAFKNMATEETTITPYGIMRSLHRRDSGLFYKIGLTDELLIESSDNVGEEPCLFKSLMFINRAIVDIDILVDEGVSPSREATKEILEKLKEK
jgi:hypothetical protein